MVAYLILMEKFAYDWSIRSKKRRFYLDKKDFLYCNTVSQFDLYLLIGLLSWNMSYAKISNVQKCMS